MDRHQQRRMVADMSRKGRYYLYRRDRGPDLGWISNENLAITGININKLRSEAMESEDYPRVLFRNLAACRARAAKDPAEQQRQREIRGRIQNETGSEPDPESMSVALSFFSSPSPYVWKYGRD